MVTVIYSDLRNSRLQTGRADAQLNAPASDATSRHFFRLVGGADLVSMNPAAG
jgi:hypothetical protein